MTLLYCDPAFLRHETGLHVESPERLRWVLERLDRSRIAAKCPRPEIVPCGRSRLARVHASTYIDQVRALARSGGGHLDPDTVVGPETYDVALLAAGSVCDAVARILRNEDATALCAVRPPGHHALATRAMGFCIFNNVALGARVATDEFGLARVLIVDWDVHHGNGTQAIFWEDPRVGYLSIHRWPFFPGTGAADETGAGPGQGTTLNVPIEWGTPRRDFIAAFAGALERIAERMKPELILVSAGFDAHKSDPIGGLGLEIEDFDTLTRLVLDVARAHAGGRVASVLEGGYLPPLLAECVERHLGGLSGRGGCE